MTNTIIPIGEEAAGWERALYAFLAEKERRSGSRRTVEGYSRTLQHFFGVAGQAARQGHEPGGLHVGLRQGTLRQRALSNHHRRPACLPQFLLPFPDTDGDRRRQPLRPDRAAQVLAQPATGDQR